MNDTIEPSLSPAPTIVGVATAVGRPGDHEAPDAVGWMERALVGALDDAAGPGGSARVELAAEVGWVGVAEGTWRCSDAGAVLAERLGLGAGGPVHTVRADIGILQQRLIAEACGAILRGEVEAAVVVGGEARARDRAIARRGGVPTETRTVTWTVDNIGDAAAAGTWVDRIYLTANGTLADAVLVASVTQNRNLAAGTGYTDATSFALPDLLDGTYRVLVVTDAGNAIYETPREDNNTRVTADGLAVVHPDLAADAVRLGANSRSLARISSRTCVLGTNPSRRTWLCNPRLAMRSVICGSISPSPAICNRRRGSIRRAAATASIASKTPFFSTRRLTINTSTVSFSTVTAGGRNDHSCRSTP